MNILEIIGLAVVIIFALAWALLIISTIYGWTHDKSQNQPPIPGGEGREEGRKARVRHPLPATQYPIHDVHKPPPTRISETQLHQESKTIQKTLAQQKQNQN